MAYRHHLTTERHEEFVKQVAEFRETFGLTQPMLAELMDVTDRTIRYIESGLVCPSAETVLRFRRVESRFLGSARIDRGPENLNGATDPRELVTPQTTSQMKTF